MVTMTAAKTAAAALAAAIAGSSAQAPCQAHQASGTLSPNAIITPYSARCQNIMSAISNARTRSAARAVSSARDQKHAWLATARGQQRARSAAARTDSSRINLQETFQLEILTVSTTFIGKPKQDVKMKVEHGIPASSQNQPKSG